MVRLLLDANADTDLADRSGETALAAAASRGHLRIARLLRDG